MWCDACGAQRLMLIEAGAMSPDILRRYLAFCYDARERLVDFNTCGAHTIMVRWTGALNCIGIDACGASRGLTNVWLRSPSADSGCGWVKWNACDSATLHAIYFKLIKFVSYWWSFKNPKQTHPLNMNINWTFLRTFSKKNLNKSSEH